MSSTGAHGANRLASNSLLEAVVYAARIAEDIDGHAIATPARLTVDSTGPRNSAMPALGDTRLRAMMTSHVGVVRNGAQLAAKDEPQVAQAGEEADAPEGEQSARARRH